VRAPVDAGDGQVAAIRAEGMVHRPGDVWSRGKEDPVLQAAAAEAPRDGKYFLFFFAANFMDNVVVPTPLIVEPTFPGKSNHFCFLSA